MIGFFDAHFQAIVWGWIALGALTLATLLRRTAPYGRYAQQAGGRTVPSALGWLLMEAPSPLLMVAWFIAGKGWRDPALVAFLALWQVHYVNRTFVFPFRRRGKQAPMPVSILGTAVLFNLVNATVNGRGLFVLAPPYGAGWLGEPRFILGVVLFAAGWLVNLHADEVLMRLRRPGESGYRIPQGGLYRWVSCPNYLGEMVEWWGFALATWSLAGLSFAVWTTANLFPRALAHHRWYRQKFSDYPPERKAVLPFVV